MNNIMLEDFWSIIFQKSFTFFGVLGHSFVKHKSIFPSNFLQAGNSC